MPGCRCNAIERQSRAAAFASWNRSFQKMDPMSVLALAPTQHEAHEQRYMPRQRIAQVLRNRYRERQDSSEEVGGDALHDRLRCDVNGVLQCRGLRGLLFMAVLALPPATVVTVETGSAAWAAPTTIASTHPEMTCARLPSAAKPRPCFDCMEFPRSPSGHFSSGEWGRSRCNAPLATSLTR